jgi:hypothetical protein
MVILQLPFAGKKRGNMGWLKGLDRFVWNKSGQLSCREAVSHRDVANQPLGESPDDHFQILVI